MLLLVATYITFDAVRAKPKFAIHVVSRAILIFHTHVCGSKGTLFANSDFGVAQSPCICLHRLTYFGKVGWQSCNVPLGRRAIGL